ncbi:hypothetical protein PLANPX_2645 [Lacipirellula parvula]|uniref:Uncharacterized protein n=1 Tax=Lacipirellula parvula TaxID=2650471 RepID=A0A5K7XFM1_9BACT|nr:hypothetical protein PLANPX_2645 [Lacipirellula parvula]
MQRAQGGRVAFWQHRRQLGPFSGLFSPGWRRGAAGQATLSPMSGRSAAGMRVALFAGAFTRIQ